MTQPTEAQIAFRVWYNEAQPLLKIQHESGLKIRDQGLFRAIRNEIEVAYVKGWKDCGEHTGAARDFDGNL